MYDALWCVPGVRACSASCARLMGALCGGTVACASAEDDCLRLFCVPLPFDGTGLTGLLPGAVSKHCHVTAHMRSARIDDTATALLLLTAD